MNERLKECESEIARESVRASFEHRAGCVLLPIFLYFLYRRKKFLYSYIGRPKSTKPPIFGPHLT